MLRGMSLALVAAAGALVVLAILGPGLLWHSGELETPFAFAAMALAIAGLGALWYARELVRQHLRDLDRLQGTLRTVRAVDALTVGARDEESLEIAHLRAAILSSLERLEAASGTSDERLGATLAAVRDAVLVVTDDGQVSLVNAAAKDLLGAERVKVGTSVFASLERASLDEAMDRVARSGHPVEIAVKSVDDLPLVGRAAPLGRHNGVVLCFEHSGAPALHGLEFDLTLLDRPPEAGPVGDDTPLAGLPALALDTETTGLDPQADRVVAIGAVRLHGSQIYYNRLLDVLIDPGQPIPVSSSRVHGITDEMVAGAGRFPEVFPQLESALGRCVIVGHHIAFDLTALQAECQRASIAWQPPLALDTLFLARELGLAADGGDLATLAATLSVEVRGRHTALGDSLVTAEVYTAMLPRLAQHGVTTLGQARALMARDKTLTKHQEAAGWTTA